MVKCPDCAAMDALKKKIEALGKKWTSGKSCDRCHGSGRVPERRHKPEPRRKDMSGEEWTEADAFWERERERMERDE